MKKTKISFSFSPLTIGYAFLRDFPARIFPWSDSISLSMRKAGMRMSHIVYISSMFFWTITIALITSIITASLFMIIFPLLRIVFPPIYSLLIPLLVAVSVGGLSITSFFFYPKYVANNKGSEIDRNIVYTSNYMSIMARAGATVEQIFGSLATYGEIYGVKHIARNVIRDIELLGKDVVSALDDVSKFSPSREFADLIQGFIATMRTGGSLGPYLSVMADELIESRRRTLAKIIDQLNLAGEIYVTALVALPIIMITMFTIMGLLGGEIMGGLTSTQLMPLLIYVFIPFMGVGVILYIDEIMASW